MPSDPRQQDNAICEVPIGVAGRIVGGAPPSALPCHAMPCHAMPCHAMPCHAAPCHAMPCHAMPCHAVPCHAMPYRATPRHATPCPALPRHAAPRHVTSYGVIPHRHATSCRVNPRSPHRVTGRTVGGAPLLEHSHGGTRFLARSPRCNSHFLACLRVRSVSPALPRLALCPDVCLVVVLCGAKPAQHVRACCAVRSLRRATGTPREPPCADGDGSRPCGAPPDTAWRRHATSRHVMQRHIATLCQVVVAWRPCGSPPYTACHDMPRRATSCNVM